jgi:hypothetical protein
VLLLLCVARKEEQEEGHGIAFFFFFVLWNCCNAAASLHGAERLQRCNASSEASPLVELCSAAPRNLKP